MKILIAFSLAILLSGCAAVKLEKNKGVYTIDGSPIGYVMEDTHAEKTDTR